MWSNNLNLDSIRATVASFSLRKFELRAHITYQHLAAKPPLRPPTLSGQIKGTWNQILLTIYPIYNTDCPLEFTNLILDCSAIEHVWIGWQKGEHLRERERERERDSIWHMPHLFCYNVFTGIPWVVLSRVVSATV